MNSEPIKNKQGKVVGRWNPQWLLDREGRTVARYDETANLTRDSKGNIVGRGDQRFRQLGKGECEE